MAAGKLAEPELLSLLMYGLLITQPTSHLAGPHAPVQRGRGPARRLAAAMDEAPEPGSGGRELPFVRGDVAFESVSFSYPNRPPVHSRLDIRIRGGETVAIIGRNGAGKS